MQNAVSGTDVIDAKQVKIEYGLQQDFRNLVAAAKEMGNLSNSQLNRAYYSNPVFEIKIKYPFV